MADHPLVFITLFSFSILLFLGFKYHLLILPFDSTMEAGAVPYLAHGGQPIIIRPRQAQGIVDRSKRAVVKTKMTKKFYQYLVGDARKGNGDARLRVGNRTLYKAARKTWLYFRRYCRYNSDRIRDPAMEEWLRRELPAEFPGVFDDAFELGRIVHPSKQIWY